LQVSPDRRSALAAGHAAALERYDPARWSDPASAAGPGNAAVAPARALAPARVASAIAPHPSRGGRAPTRCTIMPYSWPSPGICLGDNADGAVPLHEAGAAK